MVTLTPPLEGSKHPVPVPTGSPSTVPFHIGRFSSKLQRLDLRFVTRGQRRLGFLDGAWSGAEEWHKVCVCFLFFGQKPKTTSSVILALGPST